MTASGDTAIYPALDRDELPTHRPVDWQRIAYGLADENERLRNELLAVTGKQAVDVRDWQREMLIPRQPGQLPVNETVRHCNPETETK